MGKILDNRIGNEAPDLLSRLGQLNAPGGQGGDAGNVYIELVSHDATTLKKDSDRLLPLISVAGGEPGSNTKLQTPASLGTHIVDGTRCSFVEDGEWPAAIRGKEGRAVVEGVDTTTAMISLANLLAAKDSRTDYDFGMVLEQARIDINQYSTTPSSVLTAFLAKSLVQSQSSLLDDLDRVFASGTHQPGRYASPLLSGLNLSKLRAVALPDPQQTLLNQLSYFSEGSTPYDYMMHIGGVFNTDTNTQFTRLLQKLSFDEIATSNSILTEIQANISVINREMFEQVAKADAAEYISRISKLKEKIEEAQKKAQESGTPTFIGALPLIKDLGDAVGNTIASLYGEEVDYGAAAKAAGRIPQAYEALNRYDNPPD